jgi:uroporphyrin-III C-methyltransferase
MTSNSSPARGTVHLVGAGPGAPDLLTVRAVRLLGEADIVFHDALVPQEILALIKGEKVAVGKRSGLRSTAQTFINKQLLDAARRYRTVVRLKGGDPMLFGRAHEEIEFLVGKGIPVKITPGITAALAAAADLGISLTRRGKARSVAFVTPRVGEGTAESSWVRAALAADTVAIYMGADELPEIAAALIVAGKAMATPVAVVESASTPDMGLTYGTLARLPQWTSRGGPALVLIGDVYGEAAAAAALRELRQEKASQSA